MSTTPPEQGMGGGSSTMGGGGGMGGQHGGQGGGMGSMMPGAWGNARMPVPGNAEFLFFVVAMILLALIALFADSFDTPGWVDVFKWLGSAYLLSRGIAKASRVLEN